MNRETMQDFMNSSDSEVERVTEDSLVQGLSQGRKDDPVIMLDPLPRLAFILHHILSYKIEHSAVLADMEGSEFCAHLYDAYTQLASWQFERDFQLRVLAPTAGLA